ncbi:MAG: hypothetical protein QXJ92_02000 [Candidatus Pacearchaeota archaeon]
MTIVSFKGCGAGIEKLKKTKATFHKEEYIETIEKQIIESIPFSKKALEEGLIGCIEQGRIASARKVEEYAKEKGIKLELEKDKLEGAINNAYLKELSEGRILIAKDIEEYAEKKGIELKGKEIEKAIKKGYLNVLKEGEINYAKEIEEYAREKEIKLEVDREVKEALKEGYLKTLKDIKDKKLKQIKEIEEYATERSIKLEKDEKFDDALAEGYIEHLRKIVTESGRASTKKIEEKYKSNKEIKEYVEKNLGEKLSKKLKEKLGQECLNDIEEGYFNSAKDITYIAKEKGIELDKRKIKEALDKAFVTKLKEGKLEKVYEIEDLAKYVDIELKKEIEGALNEGYLRCLREGDVKEAERIENYAKRKGIELEKGEKVNEALNEGYLHALSSTTDYVRGKWVKEYAEKQRIKLNEEKAAEKLSEAYLSALRKGLVNFARGMEKEAEILGIKLKVPKKVESLFPEEIEEYARKEGIHVVRAGERIEKKVLYFPYDAYVELVYGEKPKEEGSFVLGLNRDGYLSLVCDTREKEVSDIIEDYHIKPIGGGLMEIDSKNKKIKVCKSDSKYGYEPRIVTAHLLEKALPDWKIEIEP